MLLIILIIFQFEPKYYNVDLVVKCFGYHRSQTDDFQDISFGQ